MSDNRFLRYGTLALAIVLDALFFRPAGDLRTRFGNDGGFAYGDLAAAISAQELLNQDLLSQPGVAGTAVAFDLGGQPVVKVFLTHPGALALPASFDGHPVVSEVTGPFRALGELQEPSADSDGRATPARAAPSDITNPKLSFPRPVPIGVSTGQVDVTAGTIAARVVSDSKVFALSNNHVFANRNQAEVGDNILQPGTVDGGANPTDAIGTLHDFEPIRFCQPFPVCPNNQIDAAIAETTTGSLGNSTPSNGYGTPNSKTAAARLGMAVQKYGRTTGHTRGRITGINATMNIGFRDSTARFTGQIVISGAGFSGPGDSGSLIVGGAGPEERRPVGLLFAGSQTTTLANPIDLVLARFDVSIDGN